MASVDIILLSTNIQIGFQQSRGVIRPVIDKRLQVCVSVEITDRLQRALNTIIQNDLSRNG